VFLSEFFFFFFIIITLFEKDVPCLLSFHPKKLRNDSIVKEVPSKARPPGPVEKELSLG
jgi:hypothetical protein